MFNVSHKNYSHHLHNIGANDKFYIFVGKLNIVASRSCFDADNIMNLFGLNLKSLRNTFDYGFFSS